MWAPIALRALALGMALLGLAGIGNAVGRGQPRAGSGAAAASASTSTLAHTGFDLPGLSGEALAALAAPGMSSVGNASLQGEDVRSGAGSPERGAFPFSGRDAAVPGGRASRAAADPGGDGPSESVTADAAAHVLAGANTVRETTLTAGIAGAAGAGAPLAGGDARSRGGTGAPADNAPPEASITASTPARPLSASAGFHGGPPPAVPLGAEAPPRAAEPARADVPCPLGRGELAGRQPAPATAHARQPAERGADGSAARIDLNRATAAQLRALPGVGAKRAEAIIALRERLGRLQRPGDLLRVKGIGQRTLARLLPLVSVE